MPSPSPARVLYIMATEQEYGPELQSVIQPLITGVGPVEAAITASLHLSDLFAKNRKPHVVVSLGSAASAKAKVGSVWQISTVSWRDMDARELGFEKGVTPFTDLPAAIPLHTLPVDLPRATLSTGGNVVGPDDFSTIPADLADMETFALARACSRFQIPLVGIRAISDGPEKPVDLDSWDKQVALLDRALAATIPSIAAALTALPA